MHQAVDRVAVRHVLDLTRKEKKMLRKN
jgi:hypothetical protein